MKSSRLIIMIAVALAMAIFIVVYGSLDPAEHFFPRCVFKTLTGFDCPGCGSQRAIHALLNGNPAEAWRMNALLVVSLPVIVLLFTASALRDRFPKLYRALNSRYVCLTVFAAILLWWILRNVL